MRANSPHGKYSKYSQKQKIVQHKGMIPRGKSPKAQSPGYYKHCVKINLKIILYSLH